MPLYDSIDAGINYNSKAWHQPGNFMFSMCVVRLLRNYPFGTAVNFLTILMNVVEFTFTQIFHSSFDNFLYHVSFYLSTGIQSFTATDVHIHRVCFSTAWRAGASLPACLYFWSQNAPLWALMIQHVTHTKSNSIHDLSTHTDWASLSLVLYQCDPVIYYLRNWGSRHEKCMKMNK